MKIPPKYRAALFALSLFTLLLLLTWMPEADADERNAFRRVWPVEVELRADLSGLTVPNTVVQDTLAWYTERLNRSVPGLRSSWRYEYCCDPDPNDASDTREFRSRLTLEFTRANTHQVVLRQMIAAGFLHVKDAQRQAGWTCGWLDLELPLPGQTKALRLENVGFGMQMRGSRPDHSPRS
ncbi:MAG: hypothetical protein AAF998_01125 [Bacteroidota bacterium]